MTRMRILPWLLSSCLLLLLLPSTGLGGNFMVLTGPLPPFSVNKGMRTNGIGVDTFEVIAKMTGIPFDRNKVRFVDWKRGYAETVALPGRVLLNVPRTPAVEDKFEWVGPVDFIRYVLVAKESSKAEAHSVQEAAQFRIGVVRDSGPGVALLEEGIAPQSLVMSSTYIQPLMQLRGNRIDMIAISDMGVTYQMRKLGIEKDDYKLVYAFKKVPLYFAFHKGTDPAVIDLLNKALETYKRPNPGGISAYDRHVVKYLPYGVVE